MMLSQLLCVNNYTLKGALEQVEGFMAEFSPPPRRRWTLGGSYRTRPAANVALRALDDPHRFEQKITAAEMTYRDKWEVLTGYITGLPADQEMNRMLSNRLLGVLCADEPQTNWELGQILIEMGDVLGGGYGAHLDYYDITHHTPLGDPVRQRLANNDRLGDLWLVPISIEPAALRRPPLVSHQVS